MKTKKILQKIILAPGGGAQRRRSAATTHFVFFNFQFSFFIFLLLLRRTAEANPTGLTVQSGSASAATSGSQLTVTAGNNAFLNWQSFNIAAGETTIFNQPSAASIVWNRIGDQNPSQIYGSLQANGVVVLLNSSGFYFGPNSFVSAAGLVVSTANYAPPQNAGGAWEFNGPPPLAEIVNYGQIKIGQGGSCFLIADQVENHGDIEAPGGSIGLAAGQTVTLSERPDGRGMSMKVKLPQGSVDNSGNLIADGGTIALNASVVNQDGFVQANSVQNRNGVIELVASDQLNLGADSQILAQGDNSAGGSAGGTVTLKSENIFSDASGGEISVAGGANGGAGGTVEISAPVMPAIHSTIDGHAQPGSAGGQLLLDPDYIILDTSGGDAANNGTVGVGDSPGGTLDLNVNSAFVGFSRITLQALFDITLADGTSWSLSDSTGQTSGQLVLEAGRNIIFGNADDSGNAAGIYDLNNWSIALYAGVTDFANKIVAPGAGSIYLNAFDPNNPDNSPTNPNGFIRTAAGDITLVAGQDIIVGTGSVNTTGGGSVTAHALAGNIDTGGDAQGYVFQAAASASGGYAVDSSLGVGGISTTAGGSVNLTAGGDVQSVLPSRNGYYYDGDFFSSANNANITTAGSGTFGPQAGNLNIVAGGNVTGNYLVANGTGNIFAGVQMDANGNPVRNAAGNYLLGSTGSAGTAQTSLALNLIAGGWNVTAAENIYLQEVRNPNGDFNVNAGGAFHAFDYAPSDYVNLTAGNLVQLGAPGSALPRLTGLDSLRVPFIYPGILNIAAGAGGVILDGDSSSSSYSELILYPSPLGSLTINTTDGGSLVGNLPENSDGTQPVFNLIISDSGHNQYSSAAGGLFGLNDHAATPVHLNSEMPVDLNISGNMDWLMLGSPEAATINVVGNMNNSWFQGMNLNSSDVTSINVGQAARLNMEHSGILNPATDGGLTVGGDINNRSIFTYVVVNAADAPNLALLAQAYDNTIRGVSVGATLLETSFTYDPVKKVLTYKNISGFTLPEILALLQNLTVEVLNHNGTPELDANGNIVTEQVSVLDANTAAELLAAYNQAGPVPVGLGGYTIGGGGTFAINAGSLDLATTTGIQSKGIGLYKVNGNYPLASLFSQGADITVNLTGDLDMFSSAISSLNGAGISIYAGGQIDVGSSEFTVTALGARGIYTTGQGNVSVIADGDIDVNGSRIAAYDGGNVTVESLHGDVNAGTGGSGFVVVSSFGIDPNTGAVVASAPTIPGSGILATTFPGDTGQTVGNILVEAPNGNVEASAGGIVQLPLNGVNTADSIVEVLAGLELRDSSGHPVYADNIGAGMPVQVSAAQNIDANGSGVIGSTVILDASGNINGVIFARDNININAQQNVNVTALAQGSINVSSGGTISGTLIGVGGINASGGSIDANLESNAGISGDTSGSKGMSQSSAANATSSAASASDANTVAKTDTGAEDDLLKKKKPVNLARKVSRVTVLLPGK
jgi:filamentous hemagglutinin family protein